MKLALVAALALSLPSCHTTGGRTESEVVCVGIFWKLNAASPSDVIFRPLESCSIHADESDVPVPPRWLEAACLYSAPDLLWLQQGLSLEDTTYATSYPFDPAFPERFEMVRDGESAPRRYAVVADLIEQIEATELERDICGRRSREPVRRITSP